tara:strand:- start:1742 stop:3178 length:1437 start_codon:yes stop_codon:yes gene_type:complete
MKKLFFIFTLIISHLSIFSQINLVLDYASFYLPENRPYLEVYLSIKGNSLKYVENEAGKSQAFIELTYLIEKGDSVVAYEKFQMNSPLYSAEEDLLDMRDLKRIPLDNGNYKFTLIAKDLNSGQKVESSQLIKSIDYGNNYSISDIQLLNSITQTQAGGLFEKNGYAFEPNFDHFFGPNLNQLAFYCEAYPSNQETADSLFIVNYSIREASSNKIAANLNGFKRVSLNQTRPISQLIDLKNLPSGKYNLLVELKNKANETVTSKSVTFYQSNPNLVDYSTVNAVNTFVDTMTNKEELAEYIRSLSPISSAAEREFAQNQLAYADLKFMQRYFLNFWKTRNLENPHQEWLLYHQEVKKVDMLFAYGKTKGYKTERGRVYLQYGPPSTIFDMPYEPQCYPYSIWHYNKLKDQTNRKLIFFSPTMEILGYEVLHSNIPGEAYDLNWELSLIRKSTFLRATEESPENSVINEKARDLWENPR